MLMYFARRLRPAGGTRVPPCRAEGPTQADSVGRRAPHIRSAVILSLPFQVPLIVPSACPVAVNFSTEPERQRTVTSVPALLNEPTPPSVANMGVRMSRG